MPYETSSSLKNAIKAALEKYCHDYYFTKPTHSQLAQELLQDLEQYTKENDPDERELIKLHMLYVYKRLLEKNSVHLANSLAVIIVKEYGLETGAIRRLKENTGKDFGLPYSMAHNTRHYFERLRLTIMPPTGYTGRDLNELKKEAKNQIREDLENAEHMKDLPIIQKDLVGESLKEAMPRDIKKIINNYVFWRKQAHESQPKEDVLGELPTPPASSS